MKHDLNEILAKKEKFKRYLGSTLNHIKTNSLYHFKDLIIKEADLSLEFSYYSYKDPDLIFSRPISELIDGRYYIVLSDGSHEFVGDLTVEGKLNIVGTFHLYNSQDN